MAPDTAATEPPSEVMDWLHETYTAEGVAIWLRAWRSSDEVGQRYMESLAHIDPMGT